MSSPTSRSRPLAYQARLALWLVFDTAALRLNAALSLRPAFAILFESLHGTNLACSFPSLKFGRAYCAQGQQGRVSAPVENDQETWAQGCRNAGLARCPVPGRSVPKPFLNSLTKQSMKKTFRSQTTTRLQKLLSGLPASERRLRALFVYEDAVTQLWAGEVCRQAKNVVGPDEFQATWWKLQELQQPAVLAGAVSQAMRADLIVLSTHSSEGLPLPFYYWVNSWLPHRVERGLLIGLLGVSDRATRHAGRLRQYLRVVARRAPLSLILREYYLQRATPAEIQAQRPVNGCRSRFHLLRIKR